jgi:hypothetical protein
MEQQRHPLVQIRGIMKRLFLSIVVFLLLIGSVQAKTLSYPVAAGADDAYASFGGSVNYYDQTMRLPYSSAGLAAYMRWPINIPTGATITGARVKFIAASTTYDPITIDVVDLDNCPSFVTNPQGYTVLGAHPLVGVNFTGKGFIGNTITTPDITALITDFQGRGGYVAGNYMALRFIHASGYTTSYVYTYEKGAGYAPTLEIDYTGGNVPIEVWMAEPYVRTKQYIYPRISNHNAGDVLYVYLDDALKHTYTIQAADVPANPVDAFQKASGFLMDYTGLTACSSSTDLCHHIDVVVKTAGGTTRNTYTKSWATLHSGYPKVGINEDNAICLRNDAGTGCDLYFPITGFMYDMSKFYPSFGDPFSNALNGFSGNGYDTFQNPASAKSYLNAANNTTDALTGKKWKSFVTLRGEWIPIKRGTTYSVTNSYGVSPVLNGHIYQCTTAGYTYEMTGLSMSSGTPTRVYSRDFLYTIGSTQYSTASAVTALPAGTIPQNKYGIYRFSIDAAGAITVTPGTNNATGYTDLSTYALSSAACPGLPANSRDMGYVVVRSTAAGGFIAGTTALNATGMWTDYRYVTSDVPTYNTGSGSTTNDGGSVWTEVGTYTGNYRTGTIATYNSNCSTPSNSFECSYVNQIKDYPATLGWLWEDEPGNGGPSQWKSPYPYMIDNYTATKSADTDHPHLVGMLGYDFMPPATANTAASSFSYLLNASMFSGTKTLLYDIVTGDIYPYGFTATDGSVSTYSGLPINLESTLAAEDSYIAFNYDVVPHLTVPCPEEVTHYRSCNSVNTAGSGYTVANGLTTSGGTGTGLTVDVKSVSSGGIVSFKINDLGSGYKVNDIITVIQGANTTGRIKLASVWPTGPQLKNELWLRTIHGSKGMEYFHFFCGPENYQLAEAVDYKTAMEVGDGVTPLSTIILQPKSTKYTPATRSVAVPGSSTVSVNLNHAVALAGADGRVDYMVREYGGETWVFAARVKTRGAGEAFINCTDCLAANPLKEWPDSNNTNTKSATIPVTGLAASTVVTVYGEGGRTLTAGSGTITDNFTDYDVHIYRMGTTLPEGDTTAPVISNLTPYGDLPYATTEIIGLNTNENATCRYHATNNTWATMTEMSSTGGTTHTQTVNVAVGLNSFNFKCRDAASNESIALPGSFTVADQAIPQYTVTIIQNGPVKITPDAGTHNYDAGTVLPVTWLTPEHATFQGFSGTCGCTGTTCNPTIASNCTIIGTSTSDPIWTLTVGTPTNGEIITSNVGNIFCGGGSSVCSAQFYSGDVVLAGTVSSGYYGLTWTGDGTGTTTRTVTMNGDKTVGVSSINGRAATLAPTGTKGTINLGGTGGTITLQ